jgi:acyl carrier protein
MNETQLKNRVKEIVLHSLALEDKQVGDYDCFHSDHGMDDLDIVAMVMALEDEFGIEVSDEDTRRATSLAAAMKLVDNALRQDA